VKNTEVEVSFLDRILGRISGREDLNNSAYIAKLSSDGRRLVYFSWLGGNRYDVLETEGVSDAAGNFYVAGGTSSTDFPVTVGAFQTELRGADPDNGFFGDAFVAKINDDGSLGFATLYGGSSKDVEGFFGPVIAGNGNVCATGRMPSTDLPVSAHALQPAKAGPPDSKDSVLVCFSPDGKQLRYASYFGGSGEDHGRHIAVGPDGQTFYIAGETSSRDLPLKNPPRSEYAGAFIAKFRLDEPPPVE
jgi:hypothetical protein